MIIFENPGEIDIIAISSFGVSVKESDNPIGFFGTGLKYAIAILLRTNHKITIHTGAECCEFSVQPEPVRGRMFDFVAMSVDGGAPVRLGFTTEVGKTWDIWMAYRELFCNARDEGGDAYISREHPEPESGKTFAVVEGNEFEAVHTNRWQYFVEDEPDYEIDGLQIFNRPSASFFYRGVQVAQLPRASGLTFNDTTAMELTEDRTAKDAYGIPWRISRALLQATDEDLIRRIVQAPESRLEHHLDFHGWGHITPSAEFLRVVGQLTNDGFTDINPTARKVWEEKQPKEFKPELVLLNGVQQKTLHRALAFCGCLGFTIEDYPVIVCKTLGTDTLGMAKDKTVYIAERAFTMGTKMVAGTLIEEFVHLRHKHLDCTRGMQNYLLDRMVSLGEEMLGEPL